MADMVRAGGGITISALTSQVSLGGLGSQNVHNRDRALLGLSHSGGKGQPSPPKSLPQHEAASRWQGCAQPLPIESPALLWGVACRLGRHRAIYSVALEIIYQRNLNPICKQGKGVSEAAFFPSWGQK